MDENLIRSVIALEMRAYVDGKENKASLNSFDYYYQQWVDHRDQDGGGYAWQQMVMSAVSSGYRINEGYDL